MKKKLTPLLAILSLSAAFVGCGVLPSASSSGSSSAESTASSNESIESSVQAESSVESSATQYDYTAFTAAEKALFTECLGETIPFIANNEYYVEEYSYTSKQTIETGINFYTVGNTEEEFDAYKDLLDKTYRFYNMHVEENGYVWYSYQASDYFLRVAYYQAEKGYTIDVYAYTVADWEDWDSTSPQSSIESSAESSVDSSVEDSSTQDSSVKDSSVEDVVDGDAGEILLALYGEEYDGEMYYDVYNNNTDASDQYGTVDNLIEYVKSPADTFTYVVGDSLSSTITDDNGNQIAYTFTVDSLTADSATLTFRKN